jgi:hypothetical protein
MLLHALALRDGRCAQLGKGMLDERRLADAGLAREPHDLAPACQRPLPGRVQTCQRLTPTDQGWPRLGCRGSGAGRLRSVCSRRGQRHRQRGGHETVAPARDGLDEARLARVVTQRGAQLADGGLEHRVADPAVAPDGIEQRVLGDQLARLARQGAQHAESLGWQGHGPPGLRQPGLRLVQLEHVEVQAQRVVVGHGRQTGLR